MAVLGGPREIKALISVGEERTLKQMKDDMLSGAIIPALMHRIPSELRSEACLGVSSIRMGDPLGSPRVAPLFSPPPPSSFFIFSPSLSSARRLTCSVFPRAFVRTAVQVLLLR